MMNDKNIFLINEYAILLEQVKRTAFTIQISKVFKKKIKYIFKKLKLYNLMNNNK